MNDTIYITGHKNPDTDSICSAISYAEFKKRLGLNAVAARLGEINRETEFVLKYFNIEKPEYLPTVKTQISDLNIDKVVAVSPEVSIKTAWMVMTKNNTKTLPVVDDYERLIGIATLSDITNKYMDTLENNIIATSMTPLRNISETLNAKVLCGNKDNFKTSGNVIVAAMSPEQMKNYMSSNDIIIAGNREDSQLYAIEMGASCLIVTGSSEVDKKILDSANEHGSIVMVTPFDTFTTARLINQSIPIRHVMTTGNLITFNIDDFVDEVKDKMLQTRYRSYPVVDDNNKIKGFVSRYHLISKNKKKVILMDHNEKAQSVKGIDEADILEIVDHHRVADIQTGTPIYFRNEPVGSTSTIVANAYFESGIRPVKNIAGILCAAILSDTMKFKSPTSTYVDRITAERLAEIAGIDIEEFSKEMFKAGTSLHSKTPEEIFHQDYKDFTLGHYKVGIGQVMTMDTENLEDIKVELIEYMENLMTESSYDLLILLLTDIIKEGSDMLYVDRNKDIISKAFNADPNSNSIFLPGVVSRKKQIIPPLSAAIEK